MDKIKVEGCTCYECMKHELTEDGQPYIITKPIVCPLCQNMRCPKATYHENGCTGSDEPNQPGSRYQWIKVDGMDYYEDNNLERPKPLPLPKD